MKPIGTRGLRGSGAGPGALAKAFGWERGPPGKKPTKKKKSSPDVKHGGDDHHVLLRREAVPFHLTLRRWRSTPRQKRKMGYRQRPLDRRRTRAMKRAAGGWMKVRHLIPAALPIR